MMDEQIFMIFLLILSARTVSSEEGFCSKAFGCSGDSSISKVTRYILYDVNIGEGFNLKRDVYMRMAMFVHDLAKNSNDDWHLVLPPWTKQWHWKLESHDVSYQWSSFFDLASLQLYAPVIELDQFYIDYGKPVDEVFILQHYSEFYEWTSDNDIKIDWSDRWNYAECREHAYWKQNDGTFMFYQGTKRVKAKHVRCLSFHGPSGFLESVLNSTKAKSVMFDRAEIVTHSLYGDSNYWMCRRSMRFANHLVTAAKKFRDTYLNSIDENDRTVRPLNWKEEQPHRTARGGPYLGVHLRRQDFVYGRPKDVPSLPETAKQIKKFLRQLNLTTVFVASDMDDNEYEYIKENLEKDGMKSYRYVTIDKERAKYMEGELAIIDQIIASNARYFVGTHESTFSYRIQEEREIIGFPPDTTFNRFCASFDGKGCTPPTKWLIKYPNKDIRARRYEEENFKANEL